METQDYNERILIALRQITHSIDRYSRRLRSDFKLTVPQILCLSYLKENESLTVSGISKAIHISSSTLVGILDRLEAKELIKRERNSKDRRQVLVSITPKGTAILKEAPSPLQDKLEDALTKLPELEQAAIALSLERVAGLMDAQGLDAAPILESMEISGNTDL